MMQASLFNGTASRQRRIAAAVRRLLYPGPCAWENPACPRAASNMLATLGMTAVLLLAWALAINS